MNNYSYLISQEFIVHHLFYYSIIYYENRLHRAFGFVNYENHILNSNKSKISIRALVGYFLDSLSFRLLLKRIPEIKEIEFLR